MEQEKLTKAEVSKRKETARGKRKQNAAERQAAKPKQEKQNPVTVEVLSDGTFAFHGRSVSPTRDKNRALAPYNKQILSRGVQLVIKPTDEQATMVRKTNGCVRVVRNDYLTRRIAQFQEERTTLSVAEYKAKYLPVLKDEKSWLREVDKFALEAAIEHVDAAYQHFFDGDADFPKYCSKYKPNGNRYTTKITGKNIELLRGDDGLVYIKLPKIGKVRVVLPAGKTFETILPLGTRITSATVAITGDVFTVSLSTERVVDIPTALQTYERDRLITMDMGIRKFCDFGNGQDACHHVDNPRWITKSERKLRRLQKSLSRKQYDDKAHKGSKNWEKAKQKVAKLQRHIANQRKDFQHKLSREIADACDVFICEDLNIRGMIRNRHLAKQIASVGWGQFLSFVKYKVEQKGGIFLKVSRWFPSSKRCTCGHKNTELKDQLFWKCPSCGKVNERDDTAVVNLAEEGIRLLNERGIYCAAA